MGNDGHCGLAAAIEAVIGGSATAAHHAAIEAARRRVTERLRQGVGALPPQAADRAGDAAQYALVVLVRRFRSLRSREPDALLSFLLTTARNRCIDEKRSEDREGARRRRFAGQDPPAGGPTGPGPAPPPRGRYPAPPAMDDILALQTLVIKILLAADARRPGVWAAIRARILGGTEALIPPDATPRDRNRVQQQVSRGRRYAVEIASAFDPPLTRDEMDLVRHFFGVSGRDRGTSLR